MNSIFDCDAALLKHVGEFAYSMLGLRCCETITGNKHHLVRIRQLHADVFKCDFAHRALLITATRCSRRAAKCAKQHVGNRTIHCTTHQYRKNETREPVECASDDENLVS